MDLSLQKLKQAVALREQIQTLEARLDALFAGSGQKTASRGQKRRRRPMSAATRAKLAAAARARWAKGTFGRKPKAGKKRRSGLTAAGRKRLSESMKARWAARRRGASK